MGSVDPSSHPHKFVQSHIGERLLPPLPYRRVYRTHTMVHPLPPLLYRRVYRTHNMVHPFLRPSAYKARVGGVSLRCGIKQICAGGSKSWPAHPKANDTWLGKDLFLPQLLWSEMKKSTILSHFRQLWVTESACVKNTFLKK